MKKQVLGNITALVLPGIMAASLLAGCGRDATVPADGDSRQETEGKQPEGTQQEEGGAAAMATDPSDGNATAASNGIQLPELPGGVLSLEVSIPDYQQNSEGTMIQEEWEKRMEAYLGCELDITWRRTSAQDYQESELVVLQSGKVPDIATVTRGAAVNEYGEDGTLLDLSGYADYMVYYPEYMASTNGGENYARNKDGSMYYFMTGTYNPSNYHGAQSFTSFAYRFDLLRKKGWQPAVTLDEFTGLCADMQAGIEDGSLDLDYVIMNSDKNYSLYRGFVGIFHTWDCVYYNGQEWVFGPIEDSFREMLQYLNGLYQAGYIDPEFATADSNLAATKATTGVAGICPTLWSGNVALWNGALASEEMEWGLAYLPENEDYGTAWKWGSYQQGKSLSASMGVCISARTAYPEYAVAMIDYQYSDQIVSLMNWGIEGETYRVEGTDKVFVDEIMQAEKPSMKSAEYGLMSSSICRSGIPAMPLDFDAMLELASLPEPWWNAEKGYYQGKYWIETSVNSGEDSISPYDRPPVIYLSAEEQTAKAQLSYGGVCESRVKELANQFIVGERDIWDDAEWEAYIKDVKSQTDTDFDGILKMLNDNTVGR